MRLNGNEVFFLSGTDEHGQKVEQSARNKGVEPLQFVDEVSVNFRELLDLLNISNDKFIRTTDPEHKAAVQVRSRTLDWNDESATMDNLAHWDSHIPRSTYGRLSLIKNTFT